MNRRTLWIHFSTDAPETGMFKSGPGIDLLIVKDPLSAHDFQRRAAAAEMIYLSMESADINSVLRVTDHINLSGSNPLIGPNREVFGPRFPDMSQAYISPEEDSGYFRDAAPTLIYDGGNERPQAAPIVKQCIIANHQNRRVVAWLLPPDSKIENILI